MNYRVRGPGPYAGRTITYWLYFAAFLLVIGTVGYVTMNHQQYSWLPPEITDLLVDLGIEGNGT